MSKLSLYPRLSVSVFTPGRHCIHALYKVFFLNENPGIRRRYSHALPSLYPCLVVSISMPGRRCIHASYKFKNKKNANPRNSDRDAIPATGMIYLRRADYTCSQFFNLQPKSTDSTQNRKTTSYLIGQ